MSRALKPARSWRVSSSTFDAKGDVVGLDIDHASKKLDLSIIEMVSLPPVSAAE